MPSVVIKPHHLLPKRGVVRPFNLTRIVDQARTLVQDSQSRADGILQTAQRDADQVRRAAHQQGYQEGLHQGKQEGLSAGRDQAKEQFADATEKLCLTLQQALDGADTAKSQLLAAAQQDLIALAVAIAERVVKRVGLFDRNVAVENLKAAIDMAANATELVIHISAQDAETIRLSAPDLADNFHRFEHIRWIEDPQVAPGGCRICMAGGEVDARLDTQLHQIMAELLPDGPDASPLALQRQDSSEPPLAETAGPGPQPKSAPKEQTP